MNELIKGLLLSRKEEGIKLAIILGRIRNGERIHGYYIYKSIDVEDTCAYFYSEPISTGFMYLTKFTLHE